MVRFSNTENAPKTARANTNLPIMDLLLSCNVVENWELILFIY
jgi:hypothetical protein